MREGERELFWSVKLLHKECSMKERYNNSKVFKQRKQLIWNLKFHADTVVIFREMNKTLKFTIPWYRRIIWPHVKVFIKWFQGKSVCPVIWSATEKEKPARFLGTVILYEVFCRNIKRKLGSRLCYHSISLHNCFCVCICLIFRFTYLAYYCFI